MPMHDMFKMKICKEHKNKNNQNAFNMVANVFLGDVRVIRYTFKVIVMDKYMLVSHTKHTQQKIHKSTSLAIDNMYYVSFKIQE